MPLTEKRAQVVNTLAILLLTFRTQIYSQNKRISICLCIKWICFEKFRLEESG